MSCRRVITTEGKLTHGSPADAHDKASTLMQAMRSSTVRNSDEGFHGTVVYA